MDSCLQRQISQSDCEISSNCGEKKNSDFFLVGGENSWIVAM